LLTICSILNSHHPPATAYNITNLSSGVRLEGYNAQKASFSKTINIKQIGHAVLTVPAPASDRPDKYLITLPSLHIEGLLLGSPFIELDGSSWITSSTGYTARIDYSGRGWISGKKNSFTAILYPTGKEKEVLFSISGQWTKDFEIHSGPFKYNSKDTIVDSWDPVLSPPSKLIVSPIEEQHPLESRRAWAKVAAAITKGDLETVSVEKSKIENAQRQARAKERAEGRTWQRRYFTAQNDVPDPILANLGPIVGLPTHGDSDKTGGLWRFDFEKAEAARNEPRLSQEDAAKIARELLGQ
jgi:Oxysterol-binding protein.